MFRPSYSIETFWKNLRGCWYDLTNGISNIIRWTPVIWFDRDWDWCFLAKVMEFKLRKMHRCIGNGHLMHCERRAKQILVCAELLKRLQADEYYDNVTGPLYYRHWTTPLDSSDDRVEFHIEARKPDGSLHTGEEVRRDHKRAEAVKNYDKQLLFRLMDKHLFGWWD